MLRIAAGRHGVRAAAAAAPSSPLRSLRSRLLARSGRLPAASAASSTTAESPVASASTGGEQGKVSEAPPKPRFTAFLDFKFVRDNVELLSQNARNRNSSVDVAAVAQLYDSYVEMKTKTDEIRAARNENAKAMKQKLDAEQRDAIVQEGKQLKEQLAVLEGELGLMEDRLQLEGQRIPNLTHPDVPVGSDEGIATLICEVCNPGK